MSAPSSTPPTPTIPTTATDATPSNPVSVTSATSTSTSASPTAPAPAPAPAPTSQSAKASRTSSPNSRPPKPVYAPHSSFPRLQGTTEVSVPHLYGSGPNRTFHISNDDLQFELQPKYFGGTDGIEPVLYLNAQNWEWYKQVLPSPRMHIWLLYDRIRWRDGYFKRRLVEEAIRRNIQITVRVPNRFDLCLPPTLDAPTSINPQATTDPSHPHASPFIPTALSRHTTNAAGIRTISYQGVHVPLPHAVIPRLGATIDYHGLRCMRHLESLGVKVFNPISSIEISRDKFFTHQILAPHGVPIPKSILSRTPFDLSYIEREFTYPIIIKAISGSQGVAVWKVDHRDELLELLKTFDLNAQPIIFQTYLASTRGRDLRCFVVGDRVVAAMMRTAATGFKANVHQGGTVKPIHPSPALSEFAVHTSRLSLLDFSGVDILIDHDHYKICEVNSSPGCEGLERATSCNATKAIIEYVADTVEKMHNVTSPTTSVTSAISSH